MYKLLLATALFGVASFITPTKTDFAPTGLAKSIYDFKVEGLEGDTIDFASFKGKKILVQGRER